jgi:hypothetical protein
LQRSAAGPRADAGSAPESQPVDYHPYRRPSVLSSWLWFIGKNVIGWVLILSSFIVGPALPGPGGIPLFLIGFGLVTFPGKRALTARVLRGRPANRHGRAYRRGAGLFGLIFPGLVLAALIWQRKVPHTGTIDDNLFYGGVYVGSALIAWLVALHADGLLNWFLRLVPKGRRKVRPWMRHHGIDLLPPRRRMRFLHPGGPSTREPDQEILEIKEKMRLRLAGGWRAAKPWLKRIVTIGLTVLIFVWMFKPIAHHWPAVRQRVMETSGWKFLAASAMFAVFLFVFRATTWRWILKGFGYHVPVAPATRVWSTSELARYVPGVIWQVMGRIYLIKPYGVRGSVCTTSQILELAIFLLANVTLAVCCLVWLGVRRFDETAKPWLFSAMALVPLLAFLLHPKVLYRMINAVMRHIGKPNISDHMGFPVLTGLLVWNMLGLVWQGLAIWLLVHEPLGLPIEKWWMVAGAYSLAWTAGFLSVFSPGGLGVRELVFMAAMRIALPPRIVEQFGDKAVLAGLLAFLSVLLRLWATTGELILAAIAYALDWKGAMRGGSMTTASVEGDDKQSGGAGATAA